ncbi:unnamed protein product [Kluyveromyces dobzhanskii CBS 2104]|uniref:WGS project CCBQ000000000 data, contig 00098 n=1 Tax=Kluyveromyces dobzhanskii CBS 2104 TaxID=1427455 RepID=A0A0A8L5I4_9SACH|nr:unnamed protein product [Kluyveromyces dobzhanskii CBS 2104]
MTQSKRDKRKSAVLIAAQSLDQEVKHVKNLKRLSIGSMDLLMDPELEYRVSMRQPTTTTTSSDLDAASTSTSSTEDNTHLAVPREKRHQADGSNDDVGGAVIDDDEDNLRVKRKSNASLSEEDTTAGAAIEEEDDSYSFTDDSMDVTNAEYLDQEAQANLVNNTYQREPLPRRRVLSGSLSRSASGNSSASDGTDDSKHNESLGQNLLWVRADQHPNVKPENYLELVQNTLENLNIGDHSQTSGEAQVQSLPDLKKLRRRSLQSRSSLARRPSRLRTSYTELSEDDEDRDTRDKLLPASRPVLQPKRAISLKDITEELTKLSNQAGLTDTDAVTLARTLWVAEDSSVDSNGQGPVDNSTDEDEEFASTMLVKSGFTIPTRHSLRRSKFNTYRIQSSSSNEERIIESRSPPTTNNSPNSIIGLYHDEPYTENKPIVQEFFSTLPASDDMESESSTEEADSSTDFSNEISGEAETNDKQRNAERAKSWKWTKNNNAASNDYQQAQTIPTDNLSPLKINHSRNRHNLPMSNSERNASETSINSAHSGTSTTSQTSTESSSVTITKAKASASEKRRSASMGHNYDKPLPEVHEKKQKKLNQTQNKFMKFFRKRSSSTSSEGKVLKDSVKNNIPSMPNERELKKKQSGSGLSTKFRISPKKTNKSESAKEEQLKNKDRIKLEYEKEKKLKQKLSPSKPSLQPAVTVVKNNNRQAQGELGTVNYYNTDENVGSSRDHTRVSSTQTKSQPQSQSQSQSQSESKRPIGYEEDEIEVTEFSVHDDSFTSVNSSSSMDTVKGSVLPTDQAQVSPQSSAPSSPASPPEPMQDIPATTHLPEDQQQPLQDSQYPLPPRKLTFADVLKPEQPNSPMKFTDSAFGFPLPPLTVSTVIMFDHRLPIHVERAIYRLSHLKLSDPKRVLRQQVLLSNFMYAYLNLVNHSLYLQQLEEERMGHNGNPLIDIPDM